MDLIAGCWYHGAYGVSEYGAPAFVPDVNCPHDSIESATLCAYELTPPGEHVMQCLRYDGTEFEFSMSGADKTARWDIINDLARGRMGVDMAESL